MRLQLCRTVSLLVTQNEVVNPTDNNISDSNPIYIEQCTNKQRYIIEKSLMYT